jgi:hypothetical protein
MLFGIRDGGGVEVVVALEVAALVDEPRHARACDRELKDAGAADVVDHGRLLPADLGGLARSDVPDEHPVRRVGLRDELCAGVVGDAASVDRERRHRHLEVSDLETVRCGRSRGARDERETRQQPGSQHETSPTKLLHSCTSSGGA